MVRPIRLYVSHDSAAVLPDTALSPGDMAWASSTAESVTFDGATTARINDLIGVLKKHADSWGIAGDGMYWDPRLVLNVASDGVQRARTTCGVCSRQPASRCKLTPSPRLPIPTEAPMRRGDENDDEIPGGDSFMDIVANIVGILVLLVVVVGVRAGRDVIMPPEVISDDVEAIVSLESKLEEQLRQVRREQSEIAQLTGKVASTLGEVERREAVREAAVLYNTKLRAELDEARNALSDDDQRSLQDHNEIAQAQLKLDRLTREQVALSAVEPAPEAKVVEVAAMLIVDGKVDQTISSGSRMTVWCTSRPPSLPICCGPNSTPRSCVRLPRRL